MLHAYLKELTMVLAFKEDSYAVLKPLENEVFSTELYGFSQLYSGTALLHDCYRGEKKPIASVVLCGKSELGRQLCKIPFSLQKFDVSRPICDV